MSRTRLNEIDGAELVWAPPGEFVMGGESIPPSKSPEHPVRITRGFWLYRTPVTVGQYRSFCRATNRPMSPEHPPQDNMPMVRVDWGDAVAYLRWAGARLPTEAEWEYAARGPESRRYPWGDAEPTPELAVYRAQPFDPIALMPVGSRPDGVSWCGALDMAGNVWQWCADGYDADYYARSPVDDPPGPPDGEFRVIRGGCYSFEAEYLRSSRRYIALPDRLYPFLGFRGVVDG